jgi:hypothetical protein
LNISKKIETEHFKLTASDDIYTSINIFEFIKKFKNYSMVSGIPYRVINDLVQVSNFELFNYVASDIIYRNKSLISRLSSVSIVNAPNIFYSIKYFKNKKLMSFLNNYDVVEDLPLQISIAINDFNSKIISTSTPIVLYRRTLSSTFITENSRFKNDQLKIFDYLINYYSENKNVFRTILLKNRRFLFNKKGNIKHIMNIQRIIYIFKLTLRFPLVLHKYKSLKLDIDSQQHHYNYIKSKSKSFQDQLIF